jgi:ZIP family zinc transporter/zinc and cadmium transporter
MISEIILKSSFAVISAGAGAAILFLIKLDHKKLCALISFSAGALFSAAVFNILPESYESLGIIQLLISMLTGYLLFYFVSKYFSHICPACSATHFDEKTTKKFSEIVLTLVTALSIHSLLDGIAISSVSPVLHQKNDSIFAAILIHKFPEGLALAALMLSSNYTKGKILFYVICVEAVTIIGAFIGFYFFESTISPSVISAVMAHIAGGFLFLAIHAVFGEMLKNHKNLVLGSFTLGLLLILIISYFI